MSNAPVGEKIRLARDWGEDEVNAYFAPVPRSGRSAMVESELTRTITPYAPITGGPARMALAEMSV